LQFSAKTIGPTDSVEVLLEVKNTGNRFGEETVQLYVRDVISTVSMPVRELRGFAKVGLDPAQKKTVKFVLTPKHLALYDRNLNRVVEPGQFRIFIGRSSDDSRLFGDITVLER